MPAKHAKRREKGTGKGLLGELRSLQRPRPAPLQALTSLSASSQIFRFLFSPSFACFAGNPSLLSSRVLSRALILWQTIIQTVF
jgi:hypothetical protein